MLEPEEGLLTFRSEGNNNSGSAWYSRKIHWPGNISDCSSNHSGVTIGRGFDLGSRSKDEALHILGKAGVSREQAEKIANGAGLKRCQAGDFVRENKHQMGEITELQQLKLFNVVYLKYARDAMIFYKKHRKPDSVSWEKLDNRLKDVFVDMLYQGRLRPAMVAVFGTNKKNEIINLIKSDTFLSHDEKARNRIGYITSYMK